MKTQRITGFLAEILNDFVLAFFYHLIQFKKLMKIKENPTNDWVFIGFHFPLVDSLLFSRAIESFE